MTSTKGESAPNVAQHPSEAPEPAAQSDAPPTTHGRGVSWSARRHEGHIAGLDGLRAIAILAVLVFHVHPAALSGGFIGVDIFFVVSGFLITTLLIREITTHGSLNLPRFWWRRTRRLAPALVLVVLVSVTLALVVDRDLLVGIGRQTLGALTWSTNWVEIWHGSSYFDRTSEQLFMNFWSLAVEEQFYIVWPVMFGLVLAVTKTWRQRMYLALVLAAASAVLMGVLVRPEQDATRVYYGTDTHIFGLMLGIALAFLWSSPDPTFLQGTIWRRLRPVIAIAALTTLGVLAWFLTEESVWTFRGGLVLASIATAALIATLIEHGGWWPRLMEAQPLRWIGQRSYGIYLWHWPMILIVIALMPEAQSVDAQYWAVRGAAVALTLLAAEASYRYVETPIRRDGFLPTFKAWGRTAKLGTPIGHLAKGAVAGVAVLLMATGAAIAVAPERSKTADQILDGEDQMAASQQRAKEAAEKQKAKPKPKKSGSSQKPSNSSSQGSGRGSSGKKGKTGTKGGSAEAIAGATYPGPDGRTVHGPVNVSHIKPNDDFTMPEGVDVSIFGDSMIATTLSALEHYFPGIYIDGKSNRKWGDGVVAIDKAAGSDMLRRAVVLHFGTNGGLVEEDIRGVLDRLGSDRMVVMMNLYGKSTWIDDANSTLESIAEEYPNVVIGDWHNTAKENLDMIQDDGVHPGADGAHLYAATVRAALAGLSEKATGEKPELPELECYTCG